MIEHGKTLMSFLNKKFETITFARTVLYLY